MTIKSNMPTAFHIMTKPRGAICNLDCQYCYFLSKEYQEGYAVTERSVTAEQFRKFWAYHLSRWAAPSGLDIA